VEFLDTHFQFKLIIICKEFNRKEVIKMTASEIRINKFKIDIETVGLPFEFISNSNGSPTVCQLKCKKCANITSVILKKDTIIKDITCSECNNIDDDDNVENKNDTDNEIANNELPLLYKELLVKTPEDRQDFARRLLTEIHFLNIEIPKIRRLIQKHGWTVVDNKSNIVESVHSKLYNTLTTKNQVLVKSFCDLLPKPVVNQIQQQIDEFASF
jgi:hypothetical protein